MSARSELDQIRQHMEANVSWPTMSPVAAINLQAALRDRRRLVAALTAVLDLHKDDGWGDCSACGVDAYENSIPWPCATVTAITEHLTNGDDR